MISNTKIYIIIGFFIYMIFSAIIYITVSNIITNRNNDKINKLNKTYGKEVLRQLYLVKSGKELSKLDIEYIKEKLNKELYFRSFNNSIMKFNEDKKNHEYTTKYIEKFEDIISKKIIKLSKRREDTFKIYNCYLISEYKIVNYEMSVSLTSYLKSNSMNLRIASLSAISQIGKLDNFIKAIMYISDNDKYINNKVLLDILDSFNGDIDLLDHEIMKLFNEFNDTIKKVIIDHFTNNNTEFVKDEVLDILSNDLYNKEVRISTIKYFNKVKYEKSRDEIIRILKNQDWEYRAICATTLGNYNTQITKQALLDSISDLNWYVRYNSAMSILKFNDARLIKRVFQADDRYSIDILLYAMSLKNKEYYERYIYMNEYRRA